MFHFVWKAVGSARSIRWWGLVRLCLLGGVLFVASSYWLARQVSATATESLSLFADRMLQDLSDSLGAPQQMILNGQRLHISSRVTDQPVEVVLDEFRGHCTHRSSSEAKGEALHWTNQLLLSSMGSKEEGHVACVTPSTPFDSMAEFREKLFAAFEQGDVGELGEIRYARVRKDSENVTHVLSVWSDKSFNFFQMFPEKGDAAGNDPINVPRPPQSRRIVSAEMRGTSYSTFIYKSELAAGEVLATYRATMAALGWNAQDLDATSPDEPSRAAEANDALKASRVYERQGAVAYVVATDDEAGSSNVSIVLAGGRESATSDGRTVSVE